jgi:ketosteroid isomerase-like protein
MSPPLVRLAAALIAATLALVPRSTAPAPPGARERLVAAADALAERVARDGWAAGLSASLAEDAVYLHPGEPPARGRAEVAALLARAAGAAGKPKLHRLVAGASADGTLGYAWGLLEDGDKAGRWLSAWRGGKDGWRIAALVRANAKPAPAEAPAAAPLARGYAGTPRPGEPAALLRGAFDADLAFAALAARHAKEHGFGPAFAESADPAAMIPGPAGLLWGADAIRAGYVTDPGEELTWAPDHGEAAASGDLAWTTGRATWRGGGEQAFTKYLSIWARQPDGSWRWLLDMGNLRPAPP